MTMRGTLFTVSLFYVLVVSQALPTFLLNSGRSKCVSVEAAQDTVLRIEYLAPGKYLFEKEKLLTIIFQNKQLIFLSSLDITFDKNDSNYAPTYLTINVKPSRRVLDKELHMSPIQTRLKPTSQLLEKDSGVVSHRVEVDGEANICVRASSASAAHPLRFGLRVSTTEHDPHLKRMFGHAADLNEHLSNMEVEMKRIQIGMKTILKEADFSKERDASYHQQTEAMHAATIFWPIVQICVLLMTGFTQANHIVRFFKSRRII